MFCPSSYLMGSNTTGKKSAALVWAIAPKSIQCPAHERSDTPIYVFHEGVFLSGFRSRGGSAVVVVVVIFFVCMCVWVCRSHFLDANARLLILVVLGLLLRGKKGRRMTYLIFFCEIR